MARHVVIVLSDPVEGSEGEYDDWYEKVHLDEVLATTGWSSARRFVLTDQKGARCPNRFLALYEVETDQPMDIVRRLDQTRGARRQSAAFDRKTAALWVFSPTGEPREAK
jgi:hypothetical protein